jgi:hypothetical protein
LLTNVQSLHNNVDELRVRTSFESDIRDCNIVRFTESTLSGYIAPVHRGTGKKFTGKEKLKGLLFHDK